MNSAYRFFIIKLALIIYQVNIFFLQLTIGRRVKQLINCTGIIWLLVHSTRQEHSTRQQFWIFRRGCFVRILHGFCTVPDMTWHEQSPYRCQYFVPKGRIFSNADKLFVPFKFQCYIFILVFIIECSKLLDIVLTFFELELLFHHASTISAFVNVYSWVEGPQWNSKQVLKQTKCDKGPSIPGPNPYPLH